jgi:hypothetical protein
MPNRWNMRNWWNEDGGNGTCRTTEIKPGGGGRLHICSIKKAKPGKFNAVIKQYKKIPEGLL